MVELDKIIFPNGIQKIFQIRFPSGESLNEMQKLKCSVCDGTFLAGKLFDQHLQWAKSSNYICEPASITDFLHRECPVCGMVCRILKIEASGSTGGGLMPDASDVMKLYLTADEIAELQKGGEVIGTFVGAGEIVQFDSRKDKNPDGTPKKEKKIQVCVSINEEERFWTPNSTSMRKLIAKYGSKTEDWEGQKVKLEALKQNIAGDMKLVIYGEPKD